MVETSSSAGPVSAARSVPRLDRRRSVIAGVMIGIAVMAAVDTIVYHQVLGWHHFYDRSTPDIGLLSDGFLQAAYLTLLVGGFFRFADIRRNRALATRSWWGGLLLSLGVFQLFDGLIDHKVLRLHQVRYGVDNLLAYDVAWNVAGAVLVVVGAVVLWRTRGEGASQLAGGHSTVR